MTKALLICPIFHQYHADVQSALLEHFDDVDFLPEFPKTILFRLTRKIKFLQRLHMNVYLAERLKKVKQYDFVLCIRCHYWNEKHIDLLSNNKTLYYSWDSVKNNKVLEKFLNKNIETKTFDPVDAKKYNIKYIPLFHSNNYKNHFANSMRKYQVSFICSGHSKRIAIAKLLACSKCVSIIHVYLPTLVKIKFILQGVLKVSDWKLIKTNSLSDKIVAKYVKSSQYVVDFTHPNQNGLTSRTIEALAAQTMIITNNRYALEFAQRNGLGNNVILYKNLDELCRIIEGSEYKDKVFEGKGLERSTKTWISEILNS